MIGTFSTNNTTGDRVLNLGMNPTEVEFSMAQKTSTTEAFPHKSDGMSDGTTQVCDSTFFDGVGATPGESRSFTDRCMNHMLRESGTIQNKIVGTLKSINGDGTITVNFTATVTGYRVKVKAT